MKLAFQGKNNGNVTLTADNLKFACTELGIPDDSHTLRRAARAFDLYHSGKVEHVNDHTFKVASQYNRQSYQVSLHDGVTKPYGYCTCPDWMNYSGDMDVPNVDFWCKHMISAAIWLHKNNGNGSKQTSECGSERAKELQDKLNYQLNKSGNNGNGDAKSPSYQLDISDPFQQSEQNDIDQIEGRKNGELAWKIGDKYVISFKGIMRLSEVHDIAFETAIHDDTHTVVAKARRNGSERVSGKPINGNEITALELAKRNAARQLIPYAEIKAVEHKAKLEYEFDWEVAKAKCVELVGTEANVDILIYHLVKAGKLREDNPSGYNRTEWLIIYKACQEDAQSNDGGDNSPPSETLDPKSVNNWSYNSPEFLAKCREAIQKVRDDKVEANEMPLENGNGKRKIQMDKKLRTWLIETDGTKTEISCREICEKFDSNIVTRLRAGIDSGADLSTVELDD